MSTSPPDHRFHSLDALRAFALLLGVVFHAAESFEAGHLDWAIVDSSPSTALHLFRHASHSFRMEVFFLLAGFFARLLYHRRGWKGFAWHRFQRIFIPLVIGWIILYPLLVYLWILGAAKSGSWDFLGIPPEARQLAPWKLLLGFFLQGGVFQKFNLTHLWFLHQLLVVYLIALPARSLILRLVTPSFLPRLDAAFARATLSPARVLLFAMPTIPILLAMDSWSVDTPMHSLWPHAPTTVLYGFFFTCGWFLHRAPNLLQRLTAPWPGAILLGILLILPTEAAPGWAWRHGWFASHYTSLRLAHAGAYALMMWGFVLGFLGLFVRSCHGGSPFWRYVADASYWVYLAHLPTVVALQIAVARLNLHWSAKFPFIVAIALPVLFASYHLLVRSTFVGRHLNGRAYPFQWPWLLSQLPTPRPPRAQ